MPDNAFDVLFGELFEFGRFELTREELKFIELDEFGGDSKDVSIEDSISCSMLVLFCLTRRRLISNGALPNHVINGLCNLHGSDLRRKVGPSLGRDISTIFGTQHPG